MGAASVVDIFCGIGGLTHGFVKEGFNVVAGIDVDTSCKYAYEKNNQAEFIGKSLEEVKAEEIKALYPKDSIKILVGCAPCRPFSKYTKKASKEDEWKLVLSFAELIKAVEADIVSMENVPQLEDHEVFNDFTSILKAEGYHVSSNKVECVDYGVPQTRTRLVLFASKKGNIKIINKTHPGKKHRTVRQTIGWLDPIASGQVSSEDPLHRACKLSELNLKRIKITPQGGGWKDWPEELVLECHKKETGKSYSSVYGRMWWDQPGPTITTQCHGLGNGRFGHPEQHRAISIREAALLQTFPMYYKFIDRNTKFSIDCIARHIGNAVPPRLGRVIARSIKKHLKEYYV